MHLLHASYHITSFTITINCFRFCFYRGFPQPVQKKNKLKQLEKNMLYSYKNLIVIVKNNIFISHKRESVGLVAGAPATVDDLRFLDARLILKDKVVDRMVAVTKAQPKNTISH